MVLEQSISKLNQLAQKRGQPFKVLIIDDEKWVREIYRDFCGITDAVNVELAQGGVEAVERARTNSYDIITLDLIMPEMSGLEVLSEIKRISPKVPIWVITGYATERLVQEAGVLGACRVMYKPVVLDDFLSELAASFSAKVK